MRSVQGLIYLGNDLAGFQLLTRSWSGYFSFFLWFFFFYNVRVVATTCHGSLDTVENCLAADTRFCYVRCLRLGAGKQRWWVVGFCCFIWVVEKILDDADSMLVQSAVHLPNAIHHVNV